MDCFPTLQAETVTLQFSALDPLGLVFTRFVSAAELVMYNFVKKAVVKQLQVNQWPQAFDCSPRSNIVALGTQVSPPYSCVAPNLRHPCFA
jgi:hypothetical protein